jgi:glycosyltransferase involved in cell wall biosynthesis
MRAWDGLETPLRIAGDGPLYDAVRGAVTPEIDILGQMEPEAVAGEMARAAFLVQPSECYENFPMTIAEAYCRGLPVIASRLGAMAEIVEDGITGLYFTPGDAADLTAKIRWAEAHPDEMRRMGVNARRVYEKKYTPETNYNRLFAIYENVVESNRRS